MHHLIGVYYGGIGDAFMLESNCVGEAFALGVFDMAIVCSIMFWQCEEVPSVYQMKCPCATFVGFLMDLSLASHRCERLFVVVKGATEMRIC